MAGKAVNLVLIICPPLQIAKFKMLNLRTSKTSRRCLNVPVPIDVALCSHRQLANQMEEAVTLFELDVREADIGSKTSFRLNWLFEPEFPSGGEEEEVVVTGLNATDFERLREETLDLHLSDFSDDEEAQTLAEALAKKIKHSVFDEASPVDSGNGEQQSLDDSCEMEQVNRSSSYIIFNQDIYNGSYV
jgi:hypothetical protein